MWNDAGAGMVVLSVSDENGWIVGSAKAVRYVARVAFAYALFRIFGTAGVAVDLLHLPRLFGAVLTGRAALFYLASFCSIVSVILGALLAGLQRTAVCSSDEVT